MDTYQRKNYFRDLVCFTGSDSDNYNEMPLFSQSKFLHVFGRDERVQSFLSRMEDESHFVYLFI